MKYRNISRIFLFEKRVDVCFFSLAVIAMLVSLLANFLALRNNLTFTDESYYMCLMRDVPRFGATRFHILIGDCFKNNIYANRLVCWSSQIIGSFVLAYGLWMWLDFPVNCIKKRTYSFWFLWGVLYLGQMYIVSCPSFNYITLNKIIVEMALGVVFVGLSRQKMICFVLSGFVIAFLFPVMITNTVIIPFLYMLILLLSTHKWQNVIGFTAGIVLFFVFYFVFIESPKEVATFLMEETDKTIHRGNNDYGFKMLVVWLGESLLYLAKCFFVAVALYGAYFLLVRRNCFSCRKIWQLIVLVLLSIIILLYAWTYVSPVFVFPYKVSYNYNWQNDLYWISLFLILLANLVDGKMKRNEMAIVCLLLLCPLCLSFGSNNLFYGRGASYFVFVTPALVFLAFKRSYVWRAALLLALGFCFFLFILQIIGGRNWEGQKYFGNNHIPVKSIGIDQNLKLEPRWINELVSCQERIPQGRVLCSKFHWGVICLLNYEPVCYDYAVETNDAERFKNIIDEELELNGSVWAVYYAQDFAIDFVMKMEQLGQSREYHIEADTVEMTVYSRITKEQ